jgi:hypothetical protein
MAKVTKKTQTKRAAAKKGKTRGENTGNGRTPNASELRALNAVFELLPDGLQKKGFAQLLWKASLDSTFRNKLVADARGTLKGIGAVIPAGKQIQFLVNTPNKIHIVLPPIGGIPKEKVVLRDSDLKSESSVIGQSSGDNDTGPDLLKDPTVSNTKQPRINGTIDGTDPTKRDGGDFVA